MRPNIFYRFLSIWLFVLLLVWLPCSDIAGQTACFRFLSDSVGCVPFRVRVQSCSQAPVTSIAYNFDFQKDSTFANFVNFPIDTFVYKQPGRYKIVQDIGQGRRATRYVVVRDIVAAPKIQANSCAGRQVFFTISDSVYDYFIIRYGDGNSRLVRSNDTSWVYQYNNSSPNTVSLVLEGKYSFIGCGRSLLKNLVLEQSNTESAISRLEWRGPDSLQISWQTKGAEIASTALQSGRPLLPTGAVSLPNPYKFAAAASSSLFALGLRDFCNNPSVSIPAAAIRISNLQTITGVAGSKFKLDWVYNSENMQGVFDGFYVYRNDILVYVADINKRSFLDSSAINCQDTYIYRVEAHWKLSGGFDFIQKSISQIRTIRLQAGLLTAVSNFSANYENDKLRLAWQLPDKSKARQILITNLSDGSKTVFGSGDTIMITSKKAVSSVCYSISYTDSCNNISVATPAICPIWLSQPDVKNPFLLNWTNYSPIPTGSANYKLVVWKSSNSETQIINLNNQNSYQQSQIDDQNQILRYQICVVLANGKQSCSNTIEIRQPITALLPDAFTPNNDGFNDTYMGIFKFIVKSNWKILDRWGKVIFRQSNHLTTGWDGTDNGVAVLPGVYVLVLEMTDQAGKSYSFTKNIALIR